MKYLSAPFAKLLTVAACALTLGSCNRAEYAMLPKTSSYHGVARVSTPVPVAPEAATLAPEVQSAPVTAVAPETPTVDIAKASALAAVEASRPEVVAAPAVTSVASAATVAAVPAAPRKMNLVQRLAVSKVTKQLSKAAGVTQFKEKLATAEAQKLSGNLRTGVILILLGVLIALFSRVASIFGLIGGIIAIIGLFFIVLYLLDNL